MSNRLVAATLAGLTRLLHPLKRRRRLTPFNLRLPSFSSDYGDDDLGSMATQHDRNGGRWSWSNALSVGKLRISFHPTLPAHYNFRPLHLQYVFLFGLALCCLAITQEPGWLVKGLLVLGLTYALLVPTLRQFFFPFLPIASWLLLFWACRFIPSDWRPPISVRVLPALETILYGANLSSLLSTHTRTTLDILAWLPYGIIHFGEPFVCSIVMFLWGPPGTLPVFARSFGYMNLAGVAMQLLFPCAAPWYEVLHGLSPANYAMKGSPGGLARIDALFGGSAYTVGFTEAPLVFGAFPSLHAGCATIEALFLSHVLPRAAPLFYLYIFWIWWATMYLTHHYLIDLIGGSMLAVLVFCVAKQFFLPQIQIDKRHRWEYVRVLLGEPAPSSQSALTFNSSFELLPHDATPMMELPGLQFDLERADMEREFLAHEPHDDSSHTHVSPASSWSGASSAWDDETLADEDTKV